AAGGSPTNLKGGKKIGFISDFLASASTPTQDKGVGPGEEVTVNFLLKQGETLDDVMAALGSGHLRIGVIAKNAFVTAGAAPEPGTLLLLGLGAAAAWHTRRSRS